MDAIRDRRAGAPWEDERIAGPGLKWEKGQLTLNIGSKQPIRANRNGEIVFEFDSSTMQVTTGSPYRLRANTASLAAENVRLAAENAALLARVVALEASVSSSVSGIDARLQVLEAGLP